MSRYINPDSAGKERNQLSRAVVLALRQLMRQQDADEETKDLAAFVSLSLLRISETVETSVAAWEKRGYWVKADRFRLEWEWSQGLGMKMKIALLKDDWATVALTAGQVAQKLIKITVPEHNRIGTPWVGFWDHLKD